jgi:SAM-dependent methyltransferase
MRSMSLLSSTAAVLGPPQQDAEASMHDHRSDRMIAEPWYIDSVEFLDDALVRVTGWCLPDPAFPGEAKDRFSVNGQKPLEIHYPFARPGVQDFFWHRRNAEMCGFSLTAHAKFPNGVMEIRAEDSATPAHAVARESWFIPDPELHRNVPDPERRFRVIGNRELEGFLRLGATDALRIRAAYETLTGKKWVDIGAALDWGVGCGRVARHLAPPLAERFHGCDIDADNIAWCKANLPGQYQPSKLQPPLPYADASFDVIYGVSVFTHLRLPWEAKWLQELHRVLRPGGTLLMTVHGRTAIDFAQLTPATYPELLSRVEREGLVVTSTNSQLDGFVDHPEEYVNVFHSEKHVRDVWGQWFHSIEQLRGYIFTHDLVVASRR